MLVNRATPHPFWQSPLTYCLPCWCCICTCTCIWRFILYSVLSNYRTKSGKSTKKKKKVSHKDKDKTEEDVSREESVEREEDEGEQVSSPPLLQDTPEEGLPPPALLSSEEVQEKRQVNKEEIGQQQLPQVPATTAVKTLTPDFKRQALSLKRRPKGPAPRPPPLGPKTMTLGRIGRPVEGGGDVIVKGRGFTISATETENAQRISPSEEIRTKPRSSSEAPAPPSEKVAPQSTSTPPSQRGPRHRPMRKAPSRPAPSTPQGKEKTTRGDSGKSHDTKPKTSSSSGSPRRPPPTIPTAVPPAVPQLSPQLPTMKKTAVIPLLLLP